MKILYLDEKKERAVTKALSKHGKVFHASDISDALLLLVENDFDYYFVDADTPQAQAFLKHLEHDPHLVAPRAVVLLTDNEEEDCSAWRVDTFITRGRIGQDAPYIFSHLRGEATGPAKVLSIVPGDGAREENACGRLRAFEESGAGGRTGGSDRSPGPKQATGRAGGEAAECYEHLERKEASITNWRYVAGRFTLLAVASLLLALGLWVFVWGPFGAGSAPDERSPEGTKTVDAEISPVDATPAALESEKPEDAAKKEEVLTEGETHSADAATDSSGDKRQGPGEASVAPVESPSPPAPPAASENRAPAVSISGPSTVNRGDVVTFTASGSDPDGDTFTLSWTSRTIQFTNPGAQTLTVTITDSRGASSSASKTVQVI
ncbi:MAG: hypothetical protein KKE79_04885 [Actinobacteria bacterium]|nr:hypothetical protein [Actinomycetota bacterium]